MFASACGSDEDADPAIDRSSAALLVGETTARAQADVDSFGATAGAGEAGASFACANGGTANASGAVAIAPDPLSVNVDVALAYAGCSTPQNVTINGALDFSQQVIVGGDSLVYVETVLVGRVDFTGAREASCDIDLNVTLDSSTGAIVTADGSACGYDANELNLNLRKNW
jgi:hypothetical protein